MRLMRIGLALIALGFAVVKPSFSQTVTTSRELDLEMRPAPPPDWRGGSVSADTARMSPGHLDFARYDPEQCLRAILHVQSHRYRHGELDTLRYTMDGDTLPTIAVDTGRACSAMFHNAEIPIHQLGAWIRLQLAVHEDTLALATASRWLAMELSPDDRAAALYTIASAYITASPMRLKAARAIIATIDSMGPSMAILQLRVHSALLDQWRRSFNAAEIRKESEQILTIAERGLGTLSTRAQKDAVIRAFGSVIVSYTNALAYEEGRGGLDSVWARIQHAVRDSSLTIVDWFIKQRRSLDQMVGTPFPDMHPDWVINGGANPQRPRAGRVTVMAFVSGPRRNPGVRESSELSYGSAVLRRLADRYGPSGLDIVLVTQTRGYSIGSLVQTEEEELKSIENLYLKYQKIPATILVNKTSFNKLPDGRLIPILTPLMRDFRSMVLIVDQNGVIRWLANDPYWDEVQINAYVESLLPNSVSSPNTTGAYYED